MKTYKLKACDGEHIISLEKGEYMADHSLAVQMIDNSGDYPEPYFTLTVRLEETPTLPEGCAFLARMDDADLMKWVIDNDIAYPIGVSAHSGFCEYHAVEFNKNCFSNTFNKDKSETEPTKESEEKAAQTEDNKKLGHYVVCIKSEYIRDAQVNDKLPNPIEDELVDNWTDIRISGYLDTVCAVDQDEAVEMVSTFTGYPASILYAFTLSSSYLTQERNAYYEITNRRNLNSDKETLYLLTNTFQDYTFYAKDNQMASCVASLLSDVNSVFAIDGTKSYGAVNSDGSFSMPLFYTLQERKQWRYDTFGASKITKEMLSDIIHSLRSVVAGSLEERKQYEEYLSHQSNIQAQKNYIMAWNDSYNSKENIHDLAFNLAEKLPDFFD